MKSGTPGFIGERLKEAREARGINSTSLAEMLGITRSAISLYENNNASPQPEIMLKIADKLNLPISFFLKPLLPDSGVQNPIFYRSMSSATKIARVRAERWFYWLHDDIVPYIRQYLQLPPVNIPQFDKLEDIHKLSNDDIEDLAITIRRRWGLGDGPISNMVLLLENNGTVITRIELCAETLDAFSIWCPDDNTPYIILGSDKNSAVRSRLDAAHELGHLVLHRNLDKKRLNNSSDFKLIEEQAFRFASAFLTPSNSFARDFYSPTLDALRSLKSKWLVSIGMMIKRAQDLNLITDTQAQRMWINYNRRGWRKEEPLDNALPVEIPRMLRKALDLINDEKIQIPEQILTSICLSANDVESIASLERGYFNEAFPQMNLKESDKANSPPKQKPSIQDELDDILRNYKRGNR